MQILRKLPFSDVSHTLQFAGGVVVRPYQIVVWVSLSAGDALEPDARRFPAILDTGHNHNFSIQESQLLTWAGLSPELLQRRGRFWSTDRKFRSTRRGCGCIAIDGERPTYCRG